MPIVELAMHVGFGSLFFDDEGEGSVTEPDQENQLVMAQAGSISVITGISSGHVRVSVHSLAARPDVGSQPDAGFEEYAEVSVPHGSGSTFTLHATSGLPPDDAILGKPDGQWIRFRVDATGRSANRDCVVDESGERYLIRIWPEAAFREVEGPAVPPEVEDQSPEYQAAVQAALQEALRQQQSLTVEQPVPTDRG